MVLSKHFKANKVKQLPKVYLSVIAIGLFFFLYIMLFSKTKERMTILEALSKNAQPIAKVKFTDFQEWHVTQFVEEFKLPVLMKNHPVIKKWPAIKKWSPEFFSSKDIELHAVYSNHHQTFKFYASEKPLSDTVFEYERKPFEVEKDHMLTKDFFQFLSKPQKDKWLYFSQELKYFGKSVHGHKIRNYSELGDDIEPGSDQFYVSDGGNIINVWFGGNNSTSQSHYDAIQNFFIQIYGRKRFILLEPTAHEDFHLYPSIHPSYRQSQVDFLSEVSDDLLMKIQEGNYKIHDVIVGPGEILYIPPFWFHHVIAIETSMSVNVWSDGEEVRINEQMMTARLPFESYWEPIRKRKDVYTFVRIFLSELLDVKIIDPAIDKYAQKLIARRYKTLFKKPYIPKKLNEPCPTIVAAKAIRRKYRTYAKPIAEKAKRLRSGIQDIIVYNWIEEIFRWAFGDDHIGQVGPFIKSCFPTPK